MYADSILHLKYQDKIYKISFFMQSTNKMC